MAHIGIDFGTGNTLIARFNETLERAETIEIPGITMLMEYVLPGENQVRQVQVIPSMIHYSPSETLIGDQVVSGGLAEHHDTIRWMKRGIAQGVTQRKKHHKATKGPPKPARSSSRCC